MSVIMKHVGVFFLVTVIIVFMALFFETGTKGFKNIEENARKEFLSDETSEQSKMYFHFEGNQSQSLELLKGKAILNLIYSGKSKFTVKLLHLDGTLLAVLADVNGPYNQKQIIEVPKTDEYILDVRTAGEWSLYQN